MFLHAAGGFRERPNIVLASPIFVAEDIHLNVLTLFFGTAVLVVGDIQANVLT